MPAISELRVPVSSVTVVTVFRNALSSSAARVRASVAVAGMLASCFQFIITLRVRSIASSKRSPVLERDCPGKVVMFLSKNTQFGRGYGPVERQK
jgi:hypothetical protein